MLAIARATCETCQRPRGSAIGCQFCSSLILADGHVVYLASRWQRLSGHLIDQLLLMFTLVLGWLVWFHIAARAAQSPGKRMVATYVITTQDRRPAGRSRMWLRDAGIKFLFFSLLAGYVTVGIGTLLDAAWIFFDHDGRTLHDRLAGTLVVQDTPGAPRFAPLVVLGLLALFVVSVFVGMILVFLSQVSVG